MENGFKYAKLVLDEPRAIYYSGQMLNGYIECDLSRPIIYTAITLHYNGKATVHWSELEIEEYNGNRQEVHVDYGDNEEYFSVSQCISGGMGGGNLQPGLHKVPFQFLIPSTAPSSYTSDRGRVMYTVTAYIDYPDPNMDRDVLSKEFEVVAPMDLNKTDEYVQRPMGLEIEEFYSCCCSSRPLNITLSLPAAGYCPGQCIPINVKADNRSAVEIKGILFQLIKRECFHSREPKSDYIPPGEVLLQAKTKPIMGDTKREFTVDLVVPDMIAPNLENCNIINVGFFLKVIVQVSGCNDDYEDETEIFIGLVPISSLVQQYIHPLQSDLPNAPIPQGLTNPPIQNTVAPVNNAPYANTSYPNANTGYANAGYPNANAGYPNANAGHPNANVGFLHTGYPNKNSPNPTNIAMTPMSNSNIGFLVPVTPGVGANAPYSMGPTNAPSSYMPYSNFASPSAPPPS